MFDLKPLKCLVCDYLQCLTHPALHLNFKWLIDYDSETCYTLKMDKIIAETVPRYCMAEQIS